MSAPTPISSIGSRQMQHGSTIFSVCRAPGIDRHCKLPRSMSTVVAFRIDFFLILASFISSIAKDTLPMATSEICQTRMIIQWSNSAMGISTATVATVNRNPKNIPMAAPHGFDRSSCNTLKGADVVDSVQTIVEFIVSLLVFGCRETPGDVCVYHRSRLMVAVLVGARVRYQNCAQLRC